MILSQIQHILLDEFQDTNLLQWSIFEKIIAELVAGSGVSHRTLLKPTFGPGLLIPLPLIPWPTGIWKSFRNKEISRQTNRKMDICIRLSNFSNNSRWDISKAKLQSSGDDLSEISWEIETSAGWSDNKKIVYKDISLSPPVQINNYLLVRAVILDPKPSLTQLTLTLNGIENDGQILSVPPIEIKKVKGLRLWWMPSING
jgi:hypothetical protein